ncbi:COG1355, Predicted dioxygenase [hydrothermal vent metagenome]|uniref:COG1355, Predicted dioxygenase n=1 Tax=hydrothermal vent metagenome TaxID=652676 RepID=A0A3B0VIY3_9ZZZZ
MLLQVEKRLWTVDEYHGMARAGILHENDRLELIKGEVVAMSPIGVRHAACVNRLTSLFAIQFEGKAVLSIQNSVRLDEQSEPVPDVVLFKYREDFYSQQVATAADVLLLIEVSDSTLPYDRNVKRPLYAQANITEYWLINLVDNSVEVHRQPEDGAFTETFIRYRDDEITAVAFPNVAFQVTDLLGMA